ncbi:MAG: glycosyltransferase family 39 protein [Bacteroidales bacterium]|nr:glycosyltransferase family 39 protein [Bacteroidales bacterium]
MQTHSTGIKNLTVLGGFIAFSLLMRFFSFFPTLISHDEGTYFVIAREMLLGKIYFVDLVDTKPVGLYLLIGLLFKYVASSIFLARMVAAIVIGCTSFLIYKISLHDQGKQRPAIAAGAVFIFLLSVFTQFGVFLNPELFYTFFTALAFYVFLRWRKTVGFLLLGFLLGIGFVLKYVVLVDLAAWLLFYFVTALLKKEQKEIRTAFGHCVVACLGFLIPFAVVVLYYYQIGHLKELWFYTFGVTSRVPVERTLWQALVYIGDFHLRFLPVVFFFYYGLFRKPSGNTTYNIPNGLIITWCLMVLVAVLAPGKPFGHYFIQMMVPVSIVAGRFFLPELKKPIRITKVISHPVGTIILGVLIAVQVFMQKHDYYNKPDIPKEVAAYLKPKLQPEDRIYTGNYQQVLYYLLNKDCPVKYVHRTLMCSNEHRSALEIDLAKEMETLMKKDFRFILMKGPYCYEPMNAYIRKHYRLIKEFSGGVEVYEKVGM